MTLDANKYRINIPLIDSMLKEKTPEERVEAIGKLAIITGVPIVIVAVYIGELYGFTEQLNGKLIQLKAFYHIDDIENIQK